MGRFLRFFVFILFLACFCTLFSHSVNAADQSPWLAPNELTSKDLGGIALSGLPATRGDGNIDCQKRDVLTRVGRIVPTPQVAQSHPGCVVDTAFGELSNTGYLQRPGDSVFGGVVRASGAFAPLIPIPYSPTGLVLNGGTSYGSYLAFYDNLDQTLQTSMIYTGELTHKLPDLPASYLKDQSGNMLAAQTDSMSFSVDGGWMVVDIPFVAMVRISTSTREVLPFGDAINYAIGLGPAYRTAISPDGRYAVMSSKTFDIFKLYDLTTCAAVPKTITTKVSCSYRDLLPFIKSSIPNYNGLSSIRFRGDYTLDLYTSNAGHYVVTPAGYEQAGFDYLALGDSFASGEGAYQYKSVTDTSTNKCHLSQRSYPYLIASALHLGQYESVACSGAKIEDLSAQDRKYKGQVTDGVTLENRDIAEILTQFLPGYLGQKSFIENYKAKIITVSAVGNDIGFADKIKRCLDTDTCYSSYEDRLEILNEINNQFYRLTDLYNQLKNADGPETKIYAIGYPQIAYPDGNCADNVRLNHDELEFSTLLVTRLNQMIQAAALNAGVRYVDVENALSGHRLCETDSWNVAVNGLTLGDDKINIGPIHGPIGNESYHPNAFGQNLLAAKIREQTHDFAEAMPPADANSTAPAITDDLPFLQAPKSNRAINIIRDVTGTNGGVIETGKTWFFRTPPGLGIKGFSKVRAWLNSDPYYIGEFDTDASGATDIEFTLPDSIVPGFHTLHVYGENTGGETMDLYTTVMVVGQQDSDVCGVIAPSNNDQDQDGIDDACDGYIDQVPLKVTNPNPMPLVMVSGSGISEQALIQPVGVSRNIDQPVIYETSSPQQLSIVPRPPNPTPQVAGLSTQTLVRPGSIAHQPLVKHKPKLWPYELGVFVGVLSLLGVLRLRRRA